MTPLASAAPETREISSIMKWSSTVFYNRVLLRLLRTALHIYYGLFVHVLQWDWSICAKVYTRVSACVRPCKKQNKAEKEQVTSLKSFSFLLYGGLWNGEWDEGRRNTLSPSYLDFVDLNDRLLSLPFFFIYIFKNIKNLITSMMSDSKTWPPNDIAQSFPSICTIISVMGWRTRWMKVERWRWGEGSRVGRSYR